MCRIALDWTGQICLCINATHLTTVSWMKQLIFNSYAGLILCFIHSNWVYLIFTGSHCSLPEIWDIKVLWKMDGGISGAIKPSSVLVPIGPNIRLNILCVSPFLFPGLPSISLYPHFSPFSYKEGVGTTWEKATLWASPTHCNLGQVGSLMVEASSLCICNLEDLEGAGDCTSLEPLPIVRPCAGQ